MTLSQSKGRTWSSNREASNLLCCLGSLLFNFFIMLLSLQLHKKETEKRPISLKKCLWTHIFMSCEHERCDKRQGKDRIRFIFRNESSWSSCHSHKRHLSDACTQIHTRIQTHTQTSKTEPAAGVSSGSCWVEATSEGCKCYMVVVCGAL